MKNLRELLKVNEEPLPRLYCDMDQVLVNFLGGTKEITGQDFERMNRDTRWKTINNVELPETFPVLNYHEDMERYG